MRRVCKRYRVEAKNILRKRNRYSGFRKNISFGTRKNAEYFIENIKKQGVYKKFRIKVIRC